MNGTFVRERHAPTARPAGPAPITIANGSGIQAATLRAQRFGQEGGQDVYGVRDDT
jgi:hypothetical protein